KVQKYVVENYQKRKLHQKLLKLEVSAWGKILKVQTASHYLTISTDCSIGSHIGKRLLVNQSVLKSLLAIIILLKSSLNICAKLEKVLTLFPSMVQKVEQGQLIKKWPIV